MKNTDLNYGTKLFLFLFLSVFSFNNAFSQSPNKDLFKIESKVTFSDKTVNPSYDPAYVTENFIIEEIMVYNEIKSTKDTKGKKIRRNDLPKLEASLSKYLLTDLNLKRCVEFDTTNNYTIIQSYPSSNKISGLHNPQLNRENIALEDEKKLCKNFFFEKDTILNGCHYSIVSDTTRIQNLNRITTKQSVYINHDLTDFQLHPFFEFLDNQYKGIGNRIDFWDTKGIWGTMEILISKVTDAAIQTKVKKFIEKYKSQFLNPTN